jgi:DNA-binding transcriptional LysR family regulator
LHQLHIFYKVVELGSFTKAAREVGLAQATVSEHVGSLEQAVGVRLLDRLGRKVVPTRAGVLLAEGARELVAHRERVRAELEAFLDRRTGTLTIGASTIPGNYILPAKIGRFRQSYPEVSITVQVADSAAVTGWVMDGDVEFGIVSCSPAAEAAKCAKLWRDELLVALRPDHRWAQDDAVDLRSLSTADYVAREPGSGTGAAVRDLLQSIGAVEPRVRATFGSSTAVKEAVKAGVGVSILSRFALEADLRAGTLVGLPIRGGHSQREFCLIADPRRSASPLAAELWKFLIEDAAAAQPPPSGSAS